MRLQSYFLYVMHAVNATNKIARYADFISANGLFLIRKALKN